MILCAILDGANETRGLPIMDKFTANYRVEVDPDGIGDVIWVRKTKGNAKIHIPSDGGPAIVVNHLGVWRNGTKFDSVDDAKRR